MLNTVRTLLGWVPRASHMRPVFTPEFHCHCLNIFASFYFLTFVSWACFNLNWPKLTLNHWSSSLHTLSTACTSGPSLLRVKPSSSSILLHLINLHLQPPGVMCLWVKGMHSIHSWVYLWLMHKQVARALCCYYITTLRQVLLCSPGWLSSLRSSCLRPQSAGICKHNCLIRDPNSYFKAFGAYYKNNEQYIHILERSSTVPCR